MKGIITDVQRGSLVDGPGLRTTIFLKGCPLRCIWCHNPETQKHAIELAFDPNKANDSDKRNCGLPPDENIAPETFARRAIDLLDCKAAPPTASGSEAYFHYGREASVDELVGLVLKDKDYYANTGGGVTISGGEPMAQPEFALALLQDCKAQGIHTILDTSGFMPSNHCKRTRPVTDLYLFDYKASEESQHRKLTGVSLQPILDNLDWLAQDGARILLRCPLIPGVNDDTNHLAQIVNLAKTYPDAISEVHILTWHTMGNAKYQKLGRTMHPSLPKSRVSATSKEEYRHYFKNAGLERFQVK